MPTGSILARRPGSPRRSRVPRPFGFTLIELVLVMGLLATLMALSAPSLARYFHERALQQEATRLLALTEYARGEAISQGIPMVVWMESTGRRFGLEPGSSYPARPTSVRTFTVHPDVTLGVDATATSGEGIVDLLTFAPDGTLTVESAQSVFLTDRYGSELALSQTTNQWAYEIQTVNAATR